MTTETTNVPTSDEFGFTDQMTQAILGLPDDFAATLHDKLIELREKLARCQGAMATARAEYDVEAHTALVPRRETLTLFVADAQEALQGHLAGVRQQREVNERTAYLGRAEAERKRRSGLLEARHLNRELLHLKFERESWAQRAYGGAQFDETFGAGQQAKQARRDALLAEFDFSAWELDPANTSFPEEKPVEKL